MEAAYKDKHEDFLSDLKGTSKWEIHGIAYNSVLFFFMRNLLFLSWPQILNNSWATFGLDVGMNVLPLLLCITVLNNSWYGIGLVFSILAIWIVYRQTAKLDGDFQLNESLHIPILTSKSNVILSNLRGYLLISTAIAILAVDFPAFPRRFAKTETFGTGLMDAGVGMFTIVMGLVSPEARYPTYQRSHIGKCLKTTIPLLLFGFLRLLLVKSTDYQEHVTEYGVHWNFFFTLATVKVLASILMAYQVCPENGWWGLGVLIAVFYQYTLSAHSLEDVLLHGFYGDDGRHGLLDANREGIFSCLGYLSIYLFGVSLGQRFFNRGRKPSDLLSYLKTLCIVFILINVVLFFCENWISPISRRFANLPYILWVMSMTIQMLGLFIVESIITAYIAVRGQKISDKQVHVTLEKLYMYSLLEAVNYNGLTFFVFSNILTGLVNFIFYTIYTSNLLAVIILTIYLLILSISMQLLHHYKVRLKF